MGCKSEKLIPKPKPVRVECTIEEPTGEQTTILQENEKRYCLFYETMALRISVLIAVGCVLVERVL